MYCNWKCTWGMRHSRLFIIEIESNLSYLKQLVVIVGRLKRWRIRSHRLCWFHGINIQLESWLESEKNTCKISSHIFQNLASISTKISIFKKFDSWSIYNSTIVLIQVNLFYKINNPNPTHFYLKIFKSNLIHSKWKPIVEIKRFKILFFRFKFWKYFQSTCSL